MFVYNSQTCSGPLGFLDKSACLTSKRNTHQCTISRSTSLGAVRKSDQKKCLKKKLTAKNVKFLKLLGLKVKKN